MLDKKKDKSDDITSLVDGRGIRGKLESDAEKRGEAGGLSTDRRGYHTRDFFFNF
jgi:hypothetical protein